MRGSGTARLPGLLTSLAVALALIASGACSPAALAQEWRVEAGVGQTAPEGSPAGEWFRGVSLGARHAGPTGWSYLLAGSSLAADPLPWGAAGVGGRLGLGTLAGLDLDLRASAHAYGYHSPELDLGGWGTTGELLPEARFRTGGPLTLVLHSGILAHAASDGGEPFRNLLYETGLEAVFRPGGGTRIAGDARYAVDGDGGYPFVGGSAAVSPVGPVRLEAEAGRWLSDELPELLLGLTATVGIGPRARLSAGYTQDPGHPLYRTPSRRGWHAGLSIAVGPRPASPASRVVPERSGDRTVFRVPLRYAAEAPFLAGDFTGWERVPMEREGDAWVVRLAVPAGVHRYAFVDGDRWFVPDDLARMDDGMGGVSAVLVIP